MLNETIGIMNASSGMLNLSTQLPTVGTISGIGLLVLVLAVGMSMYMAHEFNDQKSWLAKFMRWIHEVGGFKALVGGGTVAVAYGFYAVSGWVGSSDGQGALFGTLQYVAYAILGFVVLVAIGYIAEPLWRMAWEYVTNETKRRLKQ